MNRSVAVLAVIGALILIAAVPSQVLDGMFSLADRRNYADSSERNAAYDGEASLSGGGQYSSSERYIRTYYRNGSATEWRPEDEVSEIGGNPVGGGGTLYEVTRFPDAEPTQSQLDAAWRLYNRSFEAAERNGWFNYSRAVEDGFYDWKGDPTHYPNDRFHADRETLNPERPEHLMYYGEPGERILAGIMYIVHGLDKEGPQIGGPLTIWHYHRWSSPTCLLNGSILAPLRTASECRNGKIAYKTPEMVHVWFVERDEGHFATSMSLEWMPEERPEKMNKSEFIRKELEKLD